MRRRTRWIATLPFCALIALAFACPGYANFDGFVHSDGGVKAPPSTSASETNAPSIVAYAITDGDLIQIDGKLDEAIWRLAQAGDSFVCWDPDRGSPASEKTVFKVAYDSDAVYFAIACLEEDPSQIAKKLSRRDTSSNSDMVSIYIDPYHDKTTGYNFRVNPLGVQEDQYVYNDGDMDQDWDAVWEAETYQDGDGWYAELRIPLSSIRYRSNQQTWGLNVYRYMHSRGEDTAWVVWDRDTPGFVSRFGRLTGLTNIPAPRQLEILPYTVFRATDLSAVGDDKIDDFENFGMDMKYGITADLTLNATLQPDFGQVEADPAVLNLSPFETFFSEKRPFFVEGSRFFEHDDFNLFYSRRIGTGDRNSRIRFASKLTGKVAGDVSVAALFASTDVTQDGKTHNFLKEGSQGSRYFVGRFGKEFDEGKHRFNVMQTAVVNSASREDHGDRASREAYTTGADFALRFKDRSYAVRGSFVGSIIHPEPLASDPSFKPIKKYGTGGELGFSKSSGTVLYSLYGRWESDKLDLNDIGFLQSPDEMNTGAWVGYRYNPDGESKVFNRGNLNLNINNSWLYAARTGYDLHTGEEVWSYDKGHGAFATGNVNGWMQFRGFQEAWFGVSFNADGTQRYMTRSTVLLEDGKTVEEIPGGGPLISEPRTYGAWFGGQTDGRKDLVFWLEGNYWEDTAANVSTSWDGGVRWNQSSAINHHFDVGFNSRGDDTAHLGNYENPGGGIGGVSYVFGKLDQRTIDLTLRTNVLFDRNKSLEIYVQPFLTVGDYTAARELARPDSYDLHPYDRDGFRAEDNDFSYSAVNLNTVYRWEYRPGSTLFLVWTHSRSSYDERSFFDEPGRFDNGLGGGALFDNEPENVFLAKLTYWIPV